MRLRVGDHIRVLTHVWGPKIPAADRNARSAQLMPHAMRVNELEWTPKGRLIVRMFDGAGRPIALTKRELEMNGASNG